MCIRRVCIWDMRRGPGDWNHGKPSGDPATGERILAVPNLQRESSCTNQLFGIWNVFSHGNDTVNGGWVLRPEDGS